VNERPECSILASCNMQRIWQEGQRRMLDFFADTTLADLVPAQTLNTGTDAGV
jgi:DNA-binding IscR family transcriptional regulator